MRVRRIPRPRARRQTPQTAPPSQTTQFSFSAAIMWHGSRCSAQSFASHCRCGVGWSSDSGSACARYCRAPGDWVCLTCKRNSIISRLSDATSRLSASIRAPCSLRFRYPRKPRSEPTGINRARPTPKRMSIVSKSLFPFPFTL